MCLFYKYNKPLRVKKKESPKFSKLSIFLKFGLMVLYIKTNNFFPVILDILWLAHDRRISGYRKFPLKDTEFRLDPSL